MKKTIILIGLLCAAVTLFAACSGNIADNRADIGADSSTGNTQIPNPIVDCETLEDAADRTGFDLSVPETIGEFTNRTVQVIGNEIIQVIYGSGDDQISVRKASGSDDISGDYTEYAENNIVSVGTLQVTMKGTGETIHLAVWTDNGYSYAVRADSGLSSTDMGDLIAEIH